VKPTFVADGQTARLLKAAMLCEECGVLVENTPRGAIAHEAWHEEQDALRTQLQRLTEAHENRIDHRLVLRLGKLLREVLGG